MMSIRLQSRLPVQSHLPLGKTDMGKTGTCRPAQLKQQYSLSISEFFHNKFRLCITLRVRDEVNKCLRSLCPNPGRRDTDDFGQRMGSYGARPAHTAVAQVSEAFDLHPVVGRSYAP